MNSIHFYNVDQDPATAQLIHVPATHVEELTYLITQVAEEDSYGNISAYVEDLGTELEEMLSAINASPERIAELLNYELVSTDSLCS